MTFNDIELNDEQRVMALIYRNALAKQLLLAITTSRNGLPTESDIKDCYRSAETFTAMGIHKVGKEQPHGISFADLSGLN